MNVWVRSVAFLPDESISSWLVRAALAQGCDPLTLTGAIWPRWRAWTFDIDRGVEASKLQLLAQASGISRTDFEMRCLRNDAEKIAGHTLLNTGTWPWILALGSRNRKRLAGMQYCPACLATDNQPYFKRTWRFAWHTVCAIHNIPLIDRCWSCDALVCPHMLVAENKHLAICFNCAADLRLIKSSPGSTISHDFQCRSDEVLSSLKGKFNDQVLPAHQWFELARFFVVLTRYAIRNEASGNLGLLATSNRMPVYGVPLELMSSVQRAALLEKVLPLMSCGLTDFQYAFKSAGVSINGLCAISSELPYAIRGVVEGLPYRNHNKHRRGAASTKPRSKHTVCLMWARLLRKMGLRVDE